MKRAVLLAGVLVGLVLPGKALAGPCGLPTSSTMWIDFGTPEFAPLFSRPGVIAAVSTGALPAEMRAKGAKTIYWDMYLNRRVGRPATPADPKLVVPAANRLFDFAVQQSGCPTPFIALNELFGASLPTPWSATNAQYRANVLTFLQALAGRGARPFLLVSSTPYTGSPEAAEWWKAVAQVSDIVREVYPSARQLWGQGPIVAGRTLRRAYRRGAADFTAIGIPTSRLGVMLGFHTTPGTGGRDGLRPAWAWYDTVKWQALAARRVAGEFKLATVWSWGWGQWSTIPTEIDPDKQGALCVYLWTRNAGLCNGPKAGGPRFNVSRTEGQLILPGGAQCRVGRQKIQMSAIARLAQLTEDREVAYSALLARTVEARRAHASSQAVLAAERAVIAERFGGSASAYRAALSKARTSVQVARGIIADELRRRKIGLGLYVRRPSAGAVAGFYFSYPDLLVRRVRAAPPPWWLGGRSEGLALSTFAPQQVFSAPAGRRLSVRTLQGRYTVKPFDTARPLGSVSLETARPAIVAALTGAARDEATVEWSARQQELALREAVCRRDDLPQPGAPDLLDYLPFLALEG